MERNTLPPQVQSVENEAQWVERARCGDTDAFALLVESTQRFVYNLALRGVGDPQEAEDIAQEAYLRAWLGLSSFRGGSSFRTWLYRIVVNLCYNRRPKLRQELASLPVEDCEEVPGDIWGRLTASRPANPEREVEAAERRAILHRAIASLPEGYRMMILMRYQMELPYEEIAQVMSLPLGTVKTGLHRAKVQLHATLEVYERIQ